MYNEPSTLIDKCSLCDDSNGFDHSSAIFIIEGKLIQKGACSKCVANAAGRIFYCPQCNTLHKVTIKWQEDWGTAVPCSTMPCKKHSASKHLPRFRCIACNTTGKKFNINQRGQAYCENCWYSCSQCAAPYCQVPIHPKQPGIVITPGGKKFYCPDCAIVRTTPQGAPTNFHPLSWDYNPACWCVICSHLRGRLSKWHAGKRPEQDCTCSVCGVHVHTDTIVIVHGSKIYCHTCSWRLKKCKVCGERRHTKEFHVSPYMTTHKLYGACDYCIADTNLWLCNAACNRWFKSNTKCECGGVHEYNYTPIVTHFLTSVTQRNVDQDKIPFLGLELEVEAPSGHTTRNKGAQIVMGLASDYSYLVHDGTLLGTKNDGTGGQLGFEIVTHPFTFEWFEQEWHNIEKLLTTLSAKGYRSWEGKRCGLHVHISRAPMTDGHQMKFIRFVYGSVNMMLCIGQRDYRDHNLNKHSPFHGDDRSRLIEKIRDHTNPGIQSHYTALNCDKAATLEARWFRGTLNPNGVRKNVEFMHSLWYFTKAYGFSSANEINYVTWLREPQQHRRYSVLLDYLERNYITRR